MFYSKKLLAILLIIFFNVINAEFDNENCSAPCDENDTKPVCVLDREPVCFRLLPSKCFVRNMKCIFNVDYTEYHDAFCAPEMVHFMCKDGEFVGQSPPEEVEPEIQSHINSDENENHTYTDDERREYDINIKKVKNNNFV